MFPLLLFCNYPGTQATDIGLIAKTAERHGKHAMTLFTHHAEVAEDLIKDRRSGLAAKGACNLFCM
jgi:hypothetical protein